MAWYDNDPKVKKVRRAREDKERDEDIKEARALDKARADSQKGKNMSDRKIVGWFYRNGKRIPIFEKGSGKPNRVTSEHGNTRDLADAAEKARGVQLDSADRDQIMRNPRSINGERVELYGNNAGKGLYKKESATFNMYSDGDKELINFRREPWPEGLRKNVKGMGKSERASRVKDIDFKTRILDEEIRERGAKSRAFFQDSKNGRYYKDYDSPEAMNADIKKETGNKGTSLITTEEIGPKREGRRLVASKSSKGSLRTQAGKNLAEYKATRDMMAKGGALDEPGTVMAISQKLQGFDKDNRSEMRRRMWGTPDVRGKRRSMYRLPQKKEFANVQPSESYIKYVMEEYGYNRADAIRFIKNRG